MITDAEGLAAVKDVFRTCYHEAGHAVVGAVLGTPKGCDALLDVDKGRLGYTLTRFEGMREHNDRHMAVYSWAGVAAELIEFGDYDEHAARIDMQEVDADKLGCWTIEMCQEWATEILKEQWSAVTTLADHLVDWEIATAEEVEQIVAGGNPRA